jgi:formylglycine-generating enzyme required for sulfatase activity
MHGLVWEWNYDFNSALTTGESRGSANSDNTLFCGGGSLQANDKNDYAAFLRFALRSSLKAKYTVSNVGFRCVKDAAKP